jgi:hypothetical protein
MKGVLIVQAGTEVHPGETAEKTGKLFLAGFEGARKKDGDNAEGAIPDPRFEGGTHLLVLPTSKSRGTQNDGAGAARVESLFQGFLPGLSRDEMPLVEERLDPRFPELQRQLLHGRLVRVAVAQEDVVGLAHRKFLQELGLWEVYPKIRNSLLLSNLPLLAEKQVDSDRSQ